MQTYIFRTIIEPDEKGFHGFVPLLKGVHTVGKTIEETKKNLHEAIQCHIEGLTKDGILSFLSLSSNTRNSTGNTKGNYR